jgi:nicotinamide-nucleotide amidase
MTACTLICVGSELLRGKINTHASTIARRLASVGLELSAEHTVGDDEAALSALIRRALESSEIVFVTGGLGPTFDDVTREAAARACGRRLVRSPRLLAELGRKFRRAKYRSMPPANARQADLIDGAHAIPNGNGTAPGQWVEWPVLSNEQRAMSVHPSRSNKNSLLIAHRSLLVLLPGPPSELHPMLEASVLPLLRKKFPAPPAAEAHLHFVGVPESVVDDKVRPIIAVEKGVQFTILAHLGLVDFDIFVTAASRRKAEARLRRIVGKIQKKMGRAFYGMNDGYPLEKVVGDAFRRARSTLSVAESCTGGMLAKALTDVPGSSDYFLGGVVAYHNRVKRGVLNVSPDLLKRYGAVSKEVAAAMAEGIRQATGSAWGIGITGIAGPGGGTKARPVGLVYLGLVGPRVQKTVELRLRGSRDAIRQRAVISALDLLRQIYL